jgi:hypothetical protein
MTTLFRKATHCLAPLALLMIPGRAAGQASPPPRWDRIAGGPGTGCAHDSSYAFFVHPGSDRRLMIFFQGGGACWNNQNCDRQGRPTFHPQIDSTDDPNRLSGLFDLSNPRNPVGDYSIVFVPYCTADVFLGARTVPYSIPGATDTSGRQFQIRHRGRANADGAVGWVYAHVHNPSLVFVTGSSAGAIPSPLYAAQVARHYPRAKIVQLGDGAGGYRAPAIPGILGAWGATAALKGDAAFRGVDSATMTFEMLYVVAARIAPRVSFAQYKSAEDNVQLSFLSMLGVKDVKFARLLSQNLADIRRANPALRTYTAPGQMHTILRRPEFYTLAVDGVAVRDWVAGLLDGTRVSDVGQSLLADSAR